MSKMWREKLFLICVLVLVSSEYQDEQKESPRKGRLFSFNTVDEDIKVDMQFSIPFLTIPVKKTMNSISGIWSMPSVNINPASLFLGGVVIFSSTILLPFAIKSYASHYSNERYSRILDNTKFSSDPLLELASQFLADGNQWQSVGDCAFRIACWTAQRNNIDAIKVWHQAMSNNILSTLVNATAIEEAMISGRNGRDCATYTRCPMTEEHIRLLFNNLAAFTNYVRK